MNELVTSGLVLGLAVAAGLLLGGLFFGGLWWTVRRGVTSKRPALLFLGSSLLRMALVVVGFYLIAEGDWRRLLAAMVGFVLARLLLIRFAGPSVPRSASASNEAGHAP